MAEIIVDVTPSIPPGQMREGELGKAVEAILKARPGPPSEIRIARDLILAVYNHLDGDGGVREAVRGAIEEALAAPIPWKSRRG